ncbi:unnamed protein product [Penicillium glandicola]
MSPGIDPWDWTVDEIVTFLCRDKPGEWSYNLACPDLVALETSLQENSISGSSFLEITDSYVKDLGVTVIAQRQYILRASQWLQRRSPKYFQMHRQQRILEGILIEQQLPPERRHVPIAISPSLNDPVSNTSSDDHIKTATLLNAPVSSTTLDDPVNPSLVLGDPSLPQTGERRPRRMETTIVAPPPRSSLPESVFQNEPLAPNPAFGNDDFLDYLVKAHPPNDEHVLPVFGDSGSEVEYDTDTREEMKEDEGQSRSHTPPDTSGHLRDDEFNEIVDEYIEARKKHFDEVRLPKEKPKAFQIWSSGQKLPSMQSQISTRLAHLENRSQALRKALAEAQHPSRSSLIQACACLDLTVIDICLDRWKLSVLEQTTPPAKVAHPPRTPRAAKPNEKSDGEETLSSDLDSVDDTEEEADDESSEQSEDDLSIASISDSEEGEIAPDPEKLRSRTAYRGGPFCDSSSDEDLSHLFFKEENYEPPAAKRRRLEENSVQRDSPTSSLMPMTTLPLDRDVALPSREYEAEGQMEADTYRLNPMRFNTHESMDLTGDNGTETDEAVCAFDDVYSMMWATIEESGNRLHLVAKALTSLPNNRIKQLSEFLNSYIPSLYRSFAQDALKHMSDDLSAIEGWDAEESHSAMLMTAMFVSWINVIQVPSGAFTAKEVKAALATVAEDYDEDQFTSFLNCLNDLLEGYKRWLTLPSRVQPNEKKTTQNQWPKRKRAAARMTLNRAQKEGQHRKDQQDRDKQILLESQSDPTLKPVSFQEPVIYLDPYIGQYVKQHQLSGIQFMFREIIQNNREEGCLLAHTMGLGKSMQVISLLVTISAAGQSQDPAIRDQIPQEFRQSKTLVLCPPALIENWSREFTMWAPENNNLGMVRSIPAENPDRYEDICAWNDEGGVLILGYQLFCSLVGNKTDKDGDPEKQLVSELVKTCLLEGPTLVVADEAQALRNNDTLIFEATSRLRTRKRIALTGTPLSNGLKDYYWMIDWVAPQYLGTFTDFKDKFIKSIENGSHAGSTRLQRREALQRQELLLGIIGPKIQRMDMSALTVHLPRKYEFSIYFDPTKFQKAVYNLFVDDVKLGKYKSVSTKLMSFLNLLKLCCIHPALFKAQLETRDVKKSGYNQKSSSSDEHGTPLGSNLPAEEEPLSILTSEMDSLLKSVPDLLDPGLSSRVMILNEIVNQAIELGDKVLVFSSSIPTLHYLAESMDRAQMNYCLIEGNVGPAGRPELIRNFNDDPTTHVCLISTHAGGVGLNIQAANRIVIFDFLFNPTWEAQAIGRAYRLGQQKPVFVYRMIAAGTFEEKLYSKNVFKSQLAYRVVDQKNVVRQGSKNEDPYLAHCETSSQQCGVDDLAIAQDPGIMKKLKSSRCANYILAVKLSGEELDPEDRLTVAERQTVEDELRLRRLRITSLGRI